MIRTLLFIFCLCFQSSIAETLSNKAQFIRCYKLLTQSFPDPRSQVVKDVELGTIDPTTACVNILNGVSLNSSLNLNSPNDLNKKVLRTFQNIHFSWFGNKMFNSAEGKSGNLHTHDLLDVDSPALHITKAMFTSSGKYSDIFKLNQLLYSKRTGGELQVAPVSKRTKANYIFPNPKFIEGSELVGMRTFTSKKFNFSHDGNSGQLKLDVTWGGGVLGSSYYMLQNMPEARNFKSNGGVSVPRSWSKNVINDFLCRSLPVVRYSDGTPHLNNSSSLAFRKEGDCVRCHMTMDPLAGLIRSVRPKFDQVSNGRNVRTIEKWPESTTANNYNWPIHNDSNYYKNGNAGTFRYRTYDGNFMDVNVQDLDSFGVVLSNLNDSYACAAKKYYKYFTGYDVNLDDITDPAYGKTLSVSEKFHRDQVIGLGLNFKTHQSLKKLVEEIIKKNSFKDSAFEAQ